MPVIDDFIETEHAKMSWLERVFRNYPEVQRTSFYAAYAGRAKFGEATMMGPSGGRRLMAVFLLCFIGFFWLVMLGMLLNYSSPFAVVVLAFLFLSFLIVKLSRRYFFSRKFNYRIRVSASGIAIDETQYPWATIAETCIMSRHEGKTTNNYLIIFTKDRSVWKYDLFMFAISNRRLSAIVEYYKGVSGSDQTSHR